MKGLVKFVKGVPDPTFNTIPPPVAFPRMSPAMRTTSELARMGGRHVKPLPYPGTSVMMLSLIAYHPPPITTERKFGLLKECIPFSEKNKYRHWAHPWTSS